MATGSARAKWFAPCQSTSMASALEVSDSEKVRSEFERRDAEAARAFGAAAAHAGEGPAACTSAQNE